MGGLKVGGSKPHLNFKWALLRSTITLATSSEAMIKERVSSWASASRGASPDVKANPSADLEPIAHMPLPDPHHRRRAFASRGPPRRHARPDLGQGRQPFYKAGGGGLRQTRNRRRQALARPGPEGNMPLLEPGL